MTPALTRDCPACNATGRLPVKPATVFSATFRLCTDCDGDGIALTNLGRGVRNADVPAFLARMEARKAARLTATKVVSLGNGMSRLMDEELAA